MSSKNGTGPYCNGRKPKWRKLAGERLDLEPDDDELPDLCPEIDPGPPEPRRHAHEKLRDLYCSLPAGWGTDHVGVGRCRLHGGSVPIKHGGRSKLRRYGRLKHRLGDLVEEFEQEDEDEALDLLPELAAARAIFVDFVNRHEELVEALIAWHSDGDQKPGKVPSLHSAVRYLSEITKIAKRIEDIRSQNAISRPDLMRVMQEMGRVTRDTLERLDQGTITLEEAEELVRDGWLKIRVG